MTATSKSRATAAIIAALLLLLVWAAAGCGDDGAEDTTTTGGEAPTTEAPVTDTTAGGTGTTAGATDAEALYAEECAGCHGPSGEGGVGAQLSGREDLTVEQAEVTIRQGAGGMPPFEGQLTDDQITALATYVVEELAAP
jgi:mono/diheme cytochrome c family protein